jgi:hypothetical protein
MNESSFDSTRPIDTHATLSASSMYASDASPAVLRVDDVPGVERHVVTTLQILDPPGLVVQAAEEAPVAVDAIHDHPHPLRALRFRVARLEHEDQLDDVARPHERNRLARRFEERVLVLRGHVVRVFQGPAWHGSGGVPFGRLRGDHRLQCARAEEKAGRHEVEHGERAQDDGKDRSRTCTQRRGDHQ